MTTTSESEHDAKTMARGKRWEARAAKQTCAVEKHRCLREASGCYASLGLYPAHLQPDAIRAAAFG